MATTYTISRSNGFYNYTDSAGNTYITPATSLDLLVIPSSNSFYFNSIMLDYTACTAPTAVSALDLVTQLAALTG